MTSEAKPLLFVGLVGVLLLTNPSATWAQASKTGSKTAAKAASSSKAPAITGPTTLDGLYTDEQASRGKDVYLGSCRSCHTPSSHTGATFTKWWRGKKLSDLFAFVSTQMPKNDPGSLAAEDVADVVSYLLKMNAMPVGSDELYPAADSLKKYRIETKRTSSPSASTATRKKP